MSAVGGAPLLAISDLVVHFKTREGVVEALDGVDLTVHAGETLGLVGESGCGKSVTGQAILRIIPGHGRIVRGSIVLRRGVAGGAGADGEVDIVGLDDRSAQMKAIRRRDISIIFQEPMSSLSPVHTIGNQLLEVLALYEPDGEEEQHRALAIDLLGRVGIPQPELRFDAYTFELSGGMRQRAMIAMALASRPSLLIADEPTTAIDVTIQAQILGLLRELQQELGMAIIMITHNMGVVANVAERVAVMYKGRVVEQASVDAIFHEPKHPYTQGLIRSIPRLSGARVEELWNITGVVPSPYARVAGCAFHPRCQHFMPGECDVAPPPAYDVGPGHFARCYLHRQPAGAGAADGPGDGRLAAATVPDPNTHGGEAGGIR